MDFNNQDKNNNEYYGSTGGVTPTPPPKKDKSGISAFAGLIGAIILVCGIVIAIAFIGSDENPQKANKGGETDNNGAPSVTINQAPNSDKPKSDTGVLTSVEVAKKASNSVIAVLTYQNNRLSGEGSGIIMGEDKEKKNTYVITCAHIINTANTTVRIQTKDGTQYEAEIIGFDNRTDVGVLKIAKTGFTPAEFGDSSKLEVGEQVYAIGNPGGTAFYGSFTQGVVSAIDRLTSASEKGYSMSCIQHDAAINPGNSGGALVNSYGQVIGINSSKIADAEYEGMGFAVPITVAKDVVDKIIANGYVPNRPKLGITYSAVTHSQTYSMIVQMKGLPNGSVIIAEIDPSSALASTKVQAGDLITGVNGKNLDTSDILLDTIDKSKVGDEITLSICHINDDYSLNQFDVKVKLIEDKATPKAE